eukprot:SAG22_NODE_4337_length_1299_cov_1.355833_1_plen_241_part_00
MTMVAIAHTRGMIMPLLAVAHTAAAVAAVQAQPAARSVPVQLSHGGRCLAVPAASQPHLKSPLHLGSCAVEASAATLWQDSPDALGSPQLESVAAPSLCLNDDSVGCERGNDVFLTACQGTDTRVHVANHWLYGNSSIRAEFCGGDEGPAMCLAATAGGTVALGLCSEPGALGWSRRVYDGPLPPAPPPPPPAPPLPPLPPLPPPTKAPCKGCPNIVFILTGIGTARPEPPRSPAALGPC